MDDRERSLREAHSGDGCAFDYLLSIIDAERARADKLNAEIGYGGSPPLNGSWMQRLELEQVRADAAEYREKMLRLDYNKDRVLARDLAEALDGTYGLMVSHHAEDEISPILARAREAGLIGGGVTKVE